MRVQKNRGVIYTGKVGAKMRPSRAGMLSSRRVVKRAVSLCGGPLGGFKVWLCASSGFTTLPIVCRGQSGYYERGAWRPNHA